MDATRKAEIRERFEAATPTPWRACTWDVMEKPHVNTSKEGTCHHRHDIPITSADAEFVANAPTDIRDLLTDIDTLEQALINIRDNKWADMLAKVDVSQLDYDYRKPEGYRLEGTYEDDARYIYPARVMLIDAYINTLVNT